jgi:hypothetical protein
VTVFSTGKMEFLKCTELMYRRYRSSTKTAYRLQFLGVLIAVHCSAIIRLYIEKKIRLLSILDVVCGGQLSAKRRLSEAPQPDSSLSLSVSTNVCSAEKDIFPLQIKKQSLYTVNWSKQ